jgi:glycosyltransferase involved in cell wall biosynthesis
MTEAIEVHDYGHVEGFSPAVSVISPFYNRSHLLPSVLETIEHQTFRDIEWIIVDDGSEDDLTEAVDKIESSVVIRLLRLQRNLGAASARNAGIRMAAGRYIALLDSDDSWDPHKLRKQFEQLERAADHNLIVSLTRQLIVSDRTTYVAPRRLFSKGDSVGRYLFQSGGIIQSSMMFMTTDLAKSVGFVEGDVGHDDWSFALRLEQAGAHFDMLPEALTKYNDKRDRVRRSPSYCSARFDWLEEWRLNLGHGPYLAARAAFASHMSNRQPSHVRMILVAFARRAIPGWRTAYYLATWAFPFLRTFGVLAKEKWLSVHSVRVAGPPFKGRNCDGIPPNERLSRTLF